MQLPKIGWVRYRNSREVLGEIRSVTVGLSAGKRYVSISTRREVEQPWHGSRSSVGLDWGDFVHQSSNDISKNHAVVFVEDLQVKNMTGSAKGRKARPGNRVRQKSGLNRSILDASPFELRRQLEYKTQWNGGLVVAVSPQNSSRKCPECRHIAAENRKTQTQFVCVECGFSADADWVAAINIQEAGLASLAWSFSSHAAIASCQEPTEGIVCASA